MLATPLSAFTCVKHGILSTFPIKTLLLSQPNRPADREWSARWSLHSHLTSLALPKAEDQVEPPQEWDLGMWPGGANVRPPTLVLPSSWHWAWGHPPPPPSSTTVGAGGPGSHVSTLQCSSKEERTCLTRWHHWTVRRWREEDSTGMGRWHRTQALQLHQRRPGGSTGHQQEPTRTPHKVLVQYSGLENSVD